ncbi:hypothetical protein C5167_036094 [Papaver somniferum]|nr:hypothetical protein C5167_036094 [Papaver somniferum]
MECSQLKEKYEEGFKGGIEISRKDDDPSVIIYKRKKCTDVLEDYQRGKCQKCAELNREIDDLKLMKKRDAVEIEDLRINCMEMDIEVTTLSSHEIDLEKELEAYKIKCQSLSAELQRKGTELENLAVINGGLDRQCEEYSTKCIGMEEKIKGLIEEEIVMSGIVMSERERNARERICHLEEVIKNMETIERGRFAELEAYRIKCQGLSAELERKGLELENLRVVNGSLDREREKYMTRCIGIEEQIKGLTEEGIVMSQREKSARERICHLEERFAELEMLLLEMQEENEVSSERTCGDMDGRDNTADEAHFTRTETSPDSTFTPTCKPSSRQVNSAGVHVSGDSPHANNQRVAENALGHQLCSPNKMAQGHLHEMVDVSDGGGDNEGDYSETYL